MCTKIPALKLNLGQEAEKKQCTKITAIAKHKVKREMKTMIQKECDTDCDYSFCTGKRKINMPAEDYPVLMLKQKHEALRTMRETPQACENLSCICRQSMWPGASFHFSHPFLSSCHSPSHLRCKCARQERTACPPAHLLRYWHVLYSPSCPIQTPHEGLMYLQCKAIYVSEHREGWRLRLSDDSHVTFIQETGNGSH